MKVIVCDGPLELDGTAYASIECDIASVKQEKIGELVRIQRRFIIIIKRFEHIVTANLLERQNQNECFYAKNEMNSGHHTNLKM